MIRLDRQTICLRFALVVFAASLTAACFINSPGQCFGLSNLRERNDIIIMLERSSKAVVSGGCEFRVDLPARAKSGAPIDIILTLDNKGERTRRWGDTDGVRDCTIRVYDGLGRRVAYTANGEKALDPTAYSVYRCVITELAPGGSHEWRFDIAPWF